MTALVPVQCDAFRTRSDVGFRRSGEAGHHPSGEAEQGKSRGSDEGRHPELAHVKLVERIKA